MSTMDMLRLHYTLRFINKTRKLALRTGSWEIQWEIEESLAAIGIECRTKKGKGTDELALDSPTWSCQESYWKGY